MTDPFAYDDDATPLTADERQGLIPSHVTLRHELNELEQKNILEADRWAFQRKRQIVDESVLYRLHKRMFGDVWKWAGVYRKTERNLGVVPWKIPVEMRLLLDDVHYWIEHQTYPPDEIAVRFHHRLVAIHPFPNGNGRWSRLAADLLIVTLGRVRFTWGRSNLQAAGDIRRRYIDALHAADNHDLTLLVAFARS
jgi:Fic-DOC domain mobile mystery protein B